MENRIRPMVTSNQNGLYFSRALRGGGHVGGRDKYLFLVSRSFKRAAYDNGQNPSSF